MSLYNVFKSLFVSRITKNPMIGLVWWLWGKTPANLLARSAFALVCLTAFSRRHQLIKIIEDPCQTITDYINGRKKKSSYHRLKKTK